MTSLCKRCPKHRFLTNVDVLILPRITGPVPSNRMWKESWSHINDLKLVHLGYAHVLPVDLLLGAHVFHYLLLRDKQEEVVGQPVTLSAVFGWVLMGKMSTAPKNKIISMYTTTGMIDQILHRFLEIEVVSIAVKGDSADLECESIYRSSATRLPDGWYIVHLLFTQNPPFLGKSKDVVIKCLSQLENWFRNHRTYVKNTYNDAMRNYLDAGHMSRVTTNRLVFVEQREMVINLKDSPQKWHQINVYWLIY